MSHSNIHLLVGMARYNTYGRLEVLRKGIDYKYHGDEDAVVVPALILG